MYFKKTKKKRRREAGRLETFTDILYLGFICMQKPVKKMIVFLLTKLGFGPSQVPPLGCNRKCHAQLKLLRTNVQMDIGHRI